MPALMAGLMIALTHGPLGLKVLDRGIIFIDLAIAQIAGFGLRPKESKAEDSLSSLSLEFDGFAGDICRRAATV